LKVTQKEVDKTLALLAKTSLRIAELTNGMEDSVLQAKPDKQSWSVNDILAHLRSCSDLWTHSMYAMLAENQPVFSDIDERKWARVTGYAVVAFSESFQVLSLQRRNLLRVLEALPFEAWERSAIIFERKHTVFTQARRLVKHETEHLEQIKSLLE